MYVIKHDATQTSNQSHVKKTGLVIDVFEGQNVIIKKQF